MESERLQKFLARAGVASRRGAEELIRAGRVAVNGEVVTELGTKVCADTDAVLVDGEKVSQEATRLYLFNKPADVVTTMNDPQGRPCVGDFLESLPFRIYPVGRLDRDVVGLLLLTNDGDFANRLMHPRYEVPRRYWALVKGPVQEEALAALTDGIELEWGECRAAEATLRKVDKHVERLLGPVSGQQQVVELVVTSGKKHFVKKLLYAAGYPVLQLGRVAFGPYQLGNLRPGAIRKVSVSSVDF